MKTVGLPISHKENENRRALLPSDAESIRNINHIYVEKGYGDILGLTDEDFLNAGINVCTREEVLSKDIICDPKIGDADYLEDLSGKTLFGWAHAVQSRDIADKILSGKNTLYAWEDMYESGRHCFWRNNEIAGEAAVMHAYMCHGLFPYNTKVAVLGRGNAAGGAIKTLNYMGAEVVVYNRRTEQLFRQEIGNYDVIVNALLWDTSRKDHIIYRDDLRKMKRNSMIIDISCDRAGAIETSIPTTLDSPSYFVDGIRHYVVDHTPSLFYKTATESISKQFTNYIDYLISGQPNSCLENALEIRDGIILDKRIIDFQNR